MTLSKFRATAREKLSGKWGKAACITLAYMFITFIINIIQNRLPDSLKLTFSLAVTVINVPISFGLLMSFVNLYNGKETNPFDFFTLGFANFVKAWKIALNIFIKLIIPFIVCMLVIFLIIGIGTATFFSSTLLANKTTFLALIIIAIIAYIASIIWLATQTYYYSFSNVIAIENPEITPIVAVNESKKLMKGNRWKLFLLQLSFIGWAILAILTFGIGMLWLMPYIEFANIAFYKHLANENSNPIQQ